MPRPLAEREQRDEYLNDVHVADDAVGVLRAGFRSRGLDARTLYVVFGDHGEAFREHEGNVAHALFLYEENVHVPLFFALPGGGLPSRRTHALASLLDLAPSTLDLAGLAVPESHEGRSLARGGSPAVRFFTEQGVRRAGLRAGRHKFLLDEDTGRAQLFDLDADPAERRDLAAAHPDLLARYRACLGR